MTDLYLPDLTPDEVPAVCAEHNHPGSTYNAAMGKTWCRCGAVTYPGDAVDWALTRNDGPLSPWRKASKEA